MVNDADWLEFGLSRISLTNPQGATYTHYLGTSLAASTKLAEPTAQGGAGISFAAGTPGSAVVNINAENEVSFSKQLRPPTDQGGNQAKGGSRICLRWDAA